MFEEMNAAIAKAGLAGRCRLEEGDFFTAVPAGADAYLMRHIIHDWDDGKALTILRNVRRAIQPTGKLLGETGTQPASPTPGLERVLPAEPVFGEEIEGNRIGDRASGLHQVDRQRPAVAQIGSALPGMCAIMSG